MNWQLNRFIFMTVSLALAACTAQEGTGKRSPTPLDGGAEPPSVEQMNGALDTLEQLEALDEGLRISVEGETGLPVSEKTADFVELISDKAKCQATYKAAAANIMSGSALRIKVNQGTVRGLLCPVEYSLVPELRNSVEAEGRYLDSTRIFGTLLLNVADTAKEKLGLSRIRLGIQARSGARHDGPLKDEVHWTSELIVLGDIEKSSGSRVKLDYTARYIGTGPEFQFWRGSLKETLKLVKGKETVEIQIERQEVGLGAGESRVYLNRTRVKGALADRLSNLKLPFRIGL